MAQFSRLALSVAALVALSATALAADIAPAGIQVSCGSLNVTASWNDGLCASIYAPNPGAIESTSWVAMLTVENIQLLTDPTGIGAATSTGSNSWSILPLTDLEGHIQPGDAVLANICGNADDIDEFTASLEVFFLYSGSGQPSSIIDLNSGGRCPAVSVAQPSIDGAPAPAPAF